MTHLFEVRGVALGSEHFTKWKIISEELIDCQIYLILNNRIKEFHMISSGEEFSEYFTYEITFHRSVSKGLLKRMFPQCIIQPLRQRPPNRIFVTYDRETNSYLPYDDISM